MRARFLDRLVLDAVEQYGPEAEASAHIRPYVMARMAILSPNAIRQALARLEQAQHIVSTYLSLSHLRVYRIPSQIGVSHGEIRSAT